MQDNPARQPDVIRMLSLNQLCGCALALAAGVDTLHWLLRYLHITTGAIGLLSGTAAMTLPKGSLLHAKAGTVFFVSMLLMSSSGAFIAEVIVPNKGNVMGGIVTFYLVLTAWATVWRAPGQAGSLEILGALLGTSIVIVGATLGVMAAGSPTRTLNGYPPALFIIFGGIALFATVLDIRLIRRGGLKGAARTTRHLWRMCFAMFIATSSFFLGAASKRFPESVRNSAVRGVPVLLVVGALIYWLLSVRVIPAVRMRQYARLARKSA